HLLDRRAADRARRRRQRQGLLGPGGRRASRSRPVTAGTSPRGDHPRRAGLNLLDGVWYADDPHEIWTWMRREAPVYYDPVSDVWGIARYDDGLAIEKDPRTFSSRRAPRPHGMPLPMMISM